MPTSRPFVFHHPVVAVSFLLMAAAAAQIAVWSFQTILPPALTLASSPVVLHGWLFDEFQQLVEGPLGHPARAPEFIFLTGIAAGLIAGVAWFFAARLVQRPIAAWVVGILWFAHPGIALMIQRQAPMMVMVAFAAMFWLLLIAWHRYRHYGLALGAGLACGALTLMSLLGGAFLVVALAAMLLSSGKRRGRAVAAGELFLSWAVLVVPAGFMMLRGEGFDPMVMRLRSAMWAELDSGDQTPIARDALQWRAHQPSDGTARAFVFLAHELKTRPRSLLDWFGHRAVKSLYATDDNNFVRQIQAFQGVILVPALWAIVISLRPREKRWPILTGMTLALATWALAAFAEPLVRNLLPAGGIVMLLACIGVADGRERLLRLTDRISATRTTVRKRNASQSR